MFTARVLPMARAGNTCILPVCARPRSEYLQILTHLILTTTLGAPYHYYPLEMRKERGQVTCPRSHDGGSLFGVAVWLQRLLTATPAARGLLLSAA